MLVNGGWAYASLPRFCVLILSSFLFRFCHFAFFLTSIQLVCSRLRFCFSVSLFSSRKKKFCGMVGQVGGGGGGSTAETSGGEGVLVFGLGGGRLFFSPFDVFPSYFLTVLLFYSFRFCLHTLELTGTYHHHLTYTRRCQTNHLSFNSPRLLVGVCWSVPPAYGLEDLWGREGGR